MARTVFVTVGTTKFEALVAAVDTKEVAGALIQQGYTQLVVQVCGHVCVHLRVGRHACVNLCVWACLCVVCVGMLV